MNSGPVLIFDSGVGGLSIAAEIRARLPELPLAYVADSAWFPYGSRAAEILVPRIVAVAEAAVRQSGAGLLVVACNTASTLVLAELRRRLDMPIVGVVPAIKPAAQLTASGVIGLLGTERTVSGAYTADLIRTHAPHCRVRTLAAPRLVELAESAAGGEAIDPAEVHRELEPLLQGEPPDVIVLACTHFPLLRTALAEALPDGIQVIDSGAAIAARVAHLLDGNIPSRRPDGADELLLTRQDPRTLRLADAFARLGFGQAKLLDVGGGTG